MNEFKNQPTEAGLVYSISKFVGRVTPKKLRTVLTSDVTKSVRGKCQGNKNNYKSDCGVGRYVLRFCEWPPISTRSEIPVCKSIQSI